MSHERVTCATVPFASEGDDVDSSGVRLVDDRRYSVGRLLGEGGMARVHLCRDERVGRDVALKSIRPELQKRSSARARFLREAAVQGQLEHPSIVPVHDIGVHPDGSAFFVMKRIRGRTLEEIIAAHEAGNAEMLEQFSPRRMLNAFASVCLAVDFAHSRGVIHRDLKPSNIMLGSFGEVYLLDWGVAKLTSEALENDGGPASDRRGIEDSGVVATVAGTVVGTPNYMAPEQMMGRATVASDIFALGATLFEMLTRQPLRDAQTTPIKIAKGEHDARCSARAPDRHVAPELEAICVRATSRDPAERYPTARAMAAAIEEYLEGARDAARRKELAAVHVRNARRARDEAATLGAERALRIAMRELGSALVLDPDNAEARALTRDALTTPPTELPHEVEAAVAVGTDKQRREAAARWPALVLTWLLFGPLLYWAGVRDVAAMLAAICSMTVSAALALVTARREKRWAPLEYAAIAGTALAMGCVSRFFGAFILAPTLLSTFAVAMQLDPCRRTRGFALAVCVAAMMLSIALDPSSSESRVRIVLALAHVVTTVSTAAAVAVARRELTRAEERVQVQAWQVRAMLPVNPRPLIGSSLSSARTHRGIR